MQLTSDTFDEVVQYLDTHEESLRIKKLVFCICKKYWENDPNILSSVPLDDLLRELTQLKLSNEQLNYCIYKLVKTLNRPKVYTNVAKLIIDQVSKLYNSTASVAETQLLTNLNSLETYNNSIKNLDILLDQIVANLENHQEKTRLKKLLFATSKNRWENDIVVINNYGIKNLILEFKKNNSNKLSAKQALNKIVENINKKSLYLAIAQIIYSQIETLYETEVDYQEYNNETKSHPVHRLSNAVRTSHGEPCDGSPVSLSADDLNSTGQVFDTQIIHIQKDFDRSSSQVYSPKVSDFETSIIDLEEPQIITELQFVEPIPVPIQHPKYDAFELRLEILQYTNPLRAKILLFSILFHPWDRSGQDWSTLRSYTLEDLLIQLIQTGKKLKDIEAHLYRVAKSQTDVDASIQTANILVQALQRFL